MDKWMDISEACKYCPTEYDCRDCVIGNPCLDSGCEYYDRENGKCKSKDGECGVAISAL